MQDLISRQAVIDVVHKSIFDFFDICDDNEESSMTYKDEQLLEINKAITTRIKDLPSAQPEVKPIGYQDCANAMLRMWMDKVVTDGEYNRIMDKLNAFWGTRNERSD